MNITLEWIKDLQFQARNASGADLTLDGKGAAGFSPTESLLASLCGCMASDVVSILQKMRFDLEALNVSGAGQRQPDPPRFFKRIDLIFSITGTIPRDRVERAVQLSFDRYCSVFHTLRKDIEITARVELK